MARKRVTLDLPPVIPLEAGQPPDLTEAQREAFDRARAALDWAARGAADPTEAERKLMQRMAGR